MAFVLVEEGQKPLVVAGRHVKQPDDRLVVPCAAAAAVSRRLTWTAATRSAMVTRPHVGFRGVRDLSFDGANGRAVS